MSQQVNLAIFGAGGHAKVVADLAVLAGWKNLSFFEDGFTGKQKFEQWEVVGDLDDLLREKLRYQGVIVAIGNCAARREKLTRIICAGLNAVSLIHPSAIVSQYANIGRGCTLMAGSIVNAFSRIGDGCIINTAATVDHDCAIGNYVHIAPGANIAGTVRIGEGSWIGIGSTVIQNICLGQNVTVGAGAVVLNDIADSLTVVGVPARPIMSAPKPLAR